MPADTPADLSFDDFALSTEVQEGLQKVGYESPSPIQARTIPVLLEGRDVVGQAQTGTGKTAAFALPIISRLDKAQRTPQVLVLTPTRELAIQVAEAFKRYASAVPNFHVLPIYGGQSYGIQLRQLQRNPQVIVGTPGRVMDHIRRGTLVLQELRCLVLDEADEMLRMGFIDDVEWIMQQTPEKRQVALFSATMPSQIRRIAQQYLNDPVEITIQMASATADTVHQRYWMVSGVHKLDALTRILEAEPFDAVLVFVRTKLATVTLAERLEARGYACAPLSGDVPQNMRERTIERFKDGRLDVVVATDVAARGLDVDRISHVINYDIPYDVEAYIHRIGRTGRAGRTGEAILFVAPRERRLLRSIERGARQQIEMMRLPTTEQINDTRVARFKQRITDTLAEEEVGFYFELVEQYRQEHNVPAIEIAAALAKLLQGEDPLLLQNKPEPAGYGHGRDRDDADDYHNRDRSDRGDRGAFRDRDRGGDRGGGGDRDRGGDRGPKPERPVRERGATSPESGMERYRIELGRNQGVQPGNIVGAIANEGQIDGGHIGRIDIYDDYSTVDLPEGMPKEVLLDLQKARISNRELNISRDLGGASPRPRRDKPRKDDRPPAADKGKKRDKSKAKRKKPRDSK